MNKYYFSSRLSVPVSDQWNLQKIFKTIPLWEKSLKKTIKNLPKLSKYQGKLANISILQKFFQDYFFIQRNIEKIVPTEMFTSMLDEPSSGSKTSKYLPRGYFLGIS